MTAKELKEEACIPTEYLNVIKVFLFDQYEFADFCEQLCKEQREICKKIAHEKCSSIMEDIINAKMPEL